MVLIVHDGSIYGIKNIFSVIYCSQKYVETFKKNMTIINKHPKLENTGSNNVAKKLILKRDFSDLLPTLEGRAV